MEQIEASVLGTIYRNDDNGYTVLTAREGRKEITIVGSWVYTLRDYATTFDFLKSAKKLGLPIDKLITHTYPLEEINEAFKTNLAMTGLKIATINK